MATAMLIRDVRLYPIISYCISLCKTVSYYKLLHLFMKGFILLEDDVSPNKRLYPAIKGCILQYYDVIFCVGGRGRWLSSRRSWRGVTLSGAPSSSAGWDPWRRTRASSLGSGPGSSPKHKSR